MDTSLSFDVQSFTLSGAFRHLATMTSADFCPITRQVALTSAMNLLLQVLPIVRFSSPSATAGDAWTLVARRRLNTFIYFG